MSPRSFGASGFTLLEVLIAAGIASFLMLAAIGLQVNMLRTHAYAMNRIALAQDATLAITALQPLLQQAGGGSVRAWTSLWAENDCAARGPLPDCAHSDRLSLATVVDPPQECAIISTSGGGTRVGASNTPCCLDNSFLLVPLMLVSGNSFRQVFSTDVDPATCSVGFVAGQMSPNDAYPGAAFDWTGGTLSKVTVSTYYLDSTNHTLVSYRDLNNNSLIDPGEAGILMDQVFDFQVALGYDTSPQDGIVTDTGSNSDEWLYNAPGEALGTAPFAATTRSQLRMVEVGLILGSKVSTMTNTQLAVTLLDGPARSADGYELKPITIKAWLRNLGIFN